MAGRGRMAVGLVMAACGTLVAAAPAHADERVCRGSIGAQTVDNLRVPAGASCTLTGTRVEGTVKVETGATLVARRAIVDGNVQTQGHRSVVLDGGRVGGSVQIEQGQAARVLAVTINADLQSFSNRGAQEFRGNRIGGNLQCKENRPAPTGGSNVVDGNKEDQCRSL